MTEGTQFTAKVPSNPYTIMTEAGDKCADPDDHMTYGLSWHDLGQRWAEPDPKSGTLAEQVTTFTASTASDLTGPTGFGAPTPTRDLGVDEPLLQLTSGKSLIMRDQRTGRQVGGFTGVGGTGVKFTAHDGRLFVAGGDGYRIEEYRLGRQGLATQVYQAKADHTVTSMVPCGSDRLCVLERHASSDWLLMINYGRQREEWRQEVKSAQWLVPVGGGVLVSGSSAGRSWLFDQAGRSRLAEDDQEVLGGRASADSLLLFGGGSVGASPGEVSLAGRGLTGGSRPLGSQKIIAYSCSWSETHLVCATGVEFRTWRYARRQ